MAVEMGEFSILLIYLKFQNGLQRVLPFLGMKVVPWIVFKISSLTLEK